MGLVLLLSRKYCAALTATPKNFIEKFVKTVAMERPALHFESHVCGAGNMLNFYPNQTETPCQSSSMELMFILMEPVPLDFEQYFDKCQLFA